MQVRCRDCVLILFHWQVLASPRGKLVVTSWRAPELWWVGSLIQAFAVEVEPNLPFGTLLLSVIRLTGSRSCLPLRVAMVQSPRNGIFGDVLVEHGRAAVRA